MDFYNKELIEKYGAIATEKQAFFADIVGEMDWNVDMQQGEILFGNDLAFPMQVLGTFSHSSETWLWAWANSKSGISEELLEQANELKNYGEKFKIEFLTEEQFEIERNDMHYIGLIALGMGGSNGYYLGNYGAGTMCLTIKSQELEDKFPNSHHSIFTVFPQLISEYDINHKEAFVNYLSQKQYKMETNGNEIIGKSGKNTVKAIFDDLGRLAELSGDVEKD